MQSRECDVLASRVESGTLVSAELDVDRVQAFLELIDRRSADERDCRQRIAHQPASTTWFGVALTARATSDSAWSRAALPAAAYSWPGDLSGRT